MKIKLAGSYAWTIPASFYEKIPIWKYGVGTIICDTYNNGNLIGSKSSQFTATTNEEKCKPSISATIIDINQDTVNLTGDNTKLIKYKSTAKVTVNTSAKNYAVISSKKVNNISMEEDNVLIEEVESDTFVVTVTDSRGYSNSVTIKPTIINYIPLTINAVIKRTQPTTGEVDVTFSGNYFNGLIGNVNNTLSINWYYREKNSNDWINGGKITPVIKENTYSIQNASLGRIFNYQKAYEFYLNVEDKLTILQPMFNITQGIPVFNFGKDFVNIFGNLKINEVNILELIFPIGSTYVTQSDINPSEILGFGTWERLKGKVCLGLDEDDTNLNTIGKTGGEKTHTLTISEMPLHRHTANNFVYNPSSSGAKHPINVGSGSGFIAYDNNGDTGLAGDSTGGDQAHNIMQPYQVVGYMWIRKM